MYHRWSTAVHVDPATVVVGDVVNASPSYRCEHLTTVLSVEVFDTGRVALEIGCPCGSAFDVDFPADGVLSLMGTLALIG